MDFFGGKKEFSRLEDVWNKRQKKFIIQIVEARDLAAKDMDGLSDPYVKVNLISIFFFFLFKFN